MCVVGCASPAISALCEVVRPSGWVTLASFVRTAPLELDSNVSAPASCASVGDEAVAARSLEGSSERCGTIVVSAAL